MQLQLTFGRNKQFETSIFYAESVPQKGFLLVYIPERFYKFKDGLLFICKVHFTNSQCTCVTNVSVLQ